MKMESKLFKEVKQLHGSTYIITLSGDEFYWYWTSNTTIELMHKSQYGNSPYHLQKEFIDMDENSIYLVKRYVEEHEKFIKNKRFGLNRKRSNLDKILGLI